MYAIAIDGNVLATVQSRAEVIEKLRDKAVRDEAFFNSDGKVEVASFLKGRGWIPVCLELFRVH
jgi:hypothetical protein